MNIENIQKEKNVFEKKKHELLEQLKSVCPDDCHLIGMREDYIEKEDIDIIEEFLRFMTSKNVDISKVEIDQLWLHLMQYDEGLNERVSKYNDYSSDKGIEDQFNWADYQKNGIIDDKEMEKTIILHNLLAFMRTNIMYKVYKLKPKYKK